MIEIAQRMKKMLKGRIQLFNLLFFVLVLLLPNIILSTNEYLSIRGKIINIILPFGCYVLLLSMSRRPGKILLYLLPLVLVEIYQLFMCYLFGPFVVGKDMLLNMVSSDKGESNELMSTLLPSVSVGIFISVVFLIYVIFTAASRHTNSLKRRKKLMSIAIGMIIVTIPMIYLEKKTDKNYCFIDQIYPVNFAYNGYLAIKTLRQVSLYKQNVEDFHFMASSDRDSLKKELYVLVIGETSRKMNWQIYGYDRQTTPLLQSIRDSILIYKDVLTQSNTTHKSVPIILTPADAQRHYNLTKTKSLITAFKEVGYNTAVITSQPANHSYTDILLREADSYLSIRNLPDRDGKDMDILPFLDQILQQNHTKQLIILHTYGSHYNYADRYDDKKMFFSKEKATKINLKQRQTLIDTYDNTVRYSDEFIYQIIKRIAAYNASSSMIYLSDHGEDILDDYRHRRLHSTPDISAFQVAIPFIIYCNQTYRRQHRDLYQVLVSNQNKPFSSNAVFYTFLSLAGIKIPNFDISRSLAYPLPSVAKRMYIDDHDQAKPIWQMSQTPDLDSLIVKEWTMK